MNGIRENKETLAYVLRKRRGLLIVTTMLLILIVAASFALKTINLQKENLHSDAPPFDLGLKPSEILDKSTEGDLGSVLTETTPVGPEYFDDTVFIGDSLTDGIQIYEFFGDVTVISTRGINSHTALTERFYKVEGSSELLTMVEGVEYHMPRKVYIMLGTNGIEWETIEWSINGFSELIDEIKLRVPGCNIVIQSLPPATVATSEKRPAFSRENIGKYNQALLDLALKKGVYFLDVNAALQDEEGFLPQEIAAPTDGIHMKPAGYQRWYDYVVSHAIKGEAAFSIDDDGRIIYVDPEKNSDNSASGSEGNSGNPPPKEGEAEE